MYLYLIMAALFGWGFAVNLLDAPVNRTEAAACLILASSMLLMFFWIRHSHHRSRITVEWLLAHKDRITDEPQYFPDGPVFDRTISRKTRLRSFRIVTSALILTHESQLGLEIRKGPWAAVLATTWTLLLGWWGFPWGPIRTFRAVIHNLSGGETMTVDYAILTAETGWDFEKGERL